MKPIIICLSAIMLLSSCKGFHEPARIVSVTLLVDVTGDDDVIMPSIDRFKQIYAFKEDNTKGARFKIEEISDVQFSAGKMLEIPPCPAILQNPGDRKRDTKKFLAEVSISLEQLKLREKGRDHSECYQSVARCLNEIAGEDCMQKIVIVSSDLFENSDVFSVYRNADLKKLFEKPGEVEKIFLKQVPLSDLGGVCVEFNYKAKDYKDSRRYGLIVSLYQKMIEDRHGKIIISGGDLND